MARQRSPAPEICPCCGDGVPPQALACPTCGADEETGWSEETYLDGLNLPEDYEGEFSEKPVTLSPLYVIIAIVLILGMLIFFV